MNYFLQALIVILLIYPLERSLSDDGRLNDIQSIVGSYFPNLTIVFSNKKVAKNILMNKIAKIEENGNRLVQKSKNGKATIWLKKNGQVSSLRLEFKVDKHKISRGESRILHRYKRQIASTKYLRTPHSNISQIIDERKLFSVSIFKPNSHTKKPRITEVFLSEDFFK